MEVPRGARAVVDHAGDGGRPQPGDGAEPADRRRHRRAQPAHGRARAAGGAADCGPRWSASAPSAWPCCCWPSRQLPEETWVLWPIPVAAFVLYPFTKRYTWLCHLALGLTIGLAPVGRLAGGDRRPGDRADPARARRWPAGSRASTSSTRCSTWTSTARHGIHSIPARFGPGAGAVGHARPAPRRRRAAGGRRHRRRRGRGLHGRRGGLRARCWPTRTRSSARGDTTRVPVAFAQSNGLLAVVFLAFAVPR